MYPYVIFIFVIFFFNDTATTEIYTLSLHDALPIFPRDAPPRRAKGSRSARLHAEAAPTWYMTHTLPHAALDHLWQISAEDRKSTRLNSSHANISYAVFCLKKKKQTYRYDNTCKEK